MLPVYVVLNIYSGDTFSFETTYIGEDDLSTATALCEFKTNLENGSLLESITGSIDIPSKVITFNLTSTQTGNLKQPISECDFSKCFYDTQLTFENGVINTTQRGYARIYTDVTG